VSYDFFKVFIRHKEELILWIKNCLSINIKLFLEVKGFSIKGELVEIQGPFLDTRSLIQVHLGSSNDSFFIPASKLDARVTLWIYVYSNSLVINNFLVLHGRDKSVRLTIVSGVWSNPNPSVKIAFNFDGRVRDANEGCVDSDLTVVLLKLIIERSLVNISTECA